MLRETRMQGRQKLVHQVLVEGVGVAQAARVADVSRVTAHEWVAWARQQRVSAMQEYSRRPHHSTTDPRDVMCPRAGTG